MNFEANIRPIAMPQQSIYNYPLVNEQGVITGFGHISQIPPVFPDNLQVTYKRVVEWSNCQNHFVVSTNDQFFCAQDLIRQSAFCGGDQGGSFVTFNFGKPVLSGLSLRMPDFNCDGDAPGIFIRVEFFRTYIDSFLAFFP